MGLLLITRFTLQEAIRRRLFLAVVLLSVLMLGAFAILLKVATDLSLSNKFAIGSISWYSEQNERDKRRER